MTPQLSALIVAQSWIDSAILIACVAVITLDSWRSGPARAVAISLAVPATVLFLKLISGAAILAPFFAKLNTNLAQVALCGAIFVALFILIHRMVYAFSGTERGPLSALIAGMAATIVLIVGWLQLPILEVTVWHFGPSVHAVFADKYEFWWLVIAYVLLAWARS